MNFIWMRQPAAPQLARPRYERAYALRNADAVKTRVLASVRSHASEGRLTASDFGLFAPSEITQAIRETRVTRDACASRN